MEREPMDRTNLPDVSPRDLSGISCWRDDYERNVGYLDEEEGRQALAICRLRVQKLYVQKLQAENQRLRVREPRVIFVLVSYPFLFLFRCSAVCRTYYESCRLHSTPTAVLI
eukprot:GHVQ01008193.1.p1 GENE.GHVQ01008193.1~~GHVQ01008193.1.p1  ORF type:complete len:112 (+),score=6.14 GHVQ01008193.1:319-654(+)